MTDIVMRLIEEWTYATEDVMGKAAVEIERLREQVEVLFGQIERADKVIDIARYMAIYGATPELWKQLDNALLDYDKERDGE